MKQKKRIKKEKRDSIKFNVGDIVVFAGHSVSCGAEKERYLKGLCPAENDEQILKVGGKYKVVAIHDADWGFFVDVQGKGVKNDNIVVEGISGSQFIKVNKSMKLTNLAKKLLDKDTRDLIKAGYIDGDLGLTDEGREALFTILFTEKKVELVKMAQDEIKEKDSK